MGDKSVEKPRGNWSDFLEQVTKAHDGDLATIEVFGPEIGDGYEAERLPLSFIEYDRKDDVVIVAVGGRDSRYPVVLRHMIWKPQHLLADPPEPDDVRALEMIDHDGTSTIVSLFPATDAA